MIRPDTRQGRARIVVPVTFDEATRAVAAETAAAYAGLVRDGHWFTPPGGGLEAFAAGSTWRRAR